MKEHFIQGYWWDLAKDRPHACLIEGDTTTRINLGYFILEGGQYVLSEEGKMSYEKWKRNYNIKEF